MTTPSTLSTSDSQDFLDLYMHITGISEVPPLFHFWCGLSLIAACVKDRIWYEKPSSKRIIPNLYIILLGESASGKGEAITDLEELISVEVPARIHGNPPEKLVIPELNRFNGTITAPYLSKFLSVKRCVYLVMPELSQSLTNRTLTEWFIRPMCELSRPKGSHVDATVKHGGIEIKNQVINWIAGSNKTWLIEAIPESSIQGGLIGRSVVVEGDRKGKRIWEPLSPPDRKDIIVYLKEAIQFYMELSGQFTYTDGAREIQKVWYHGKPEETDEALRPSWLREDDLIFKLSMLFALSDLSRINEKDLIVQARHVKAAINTISDLWKPVKTLAEAIVAPLSPEARGLAMMRRIIKQFPVSAHKYIKKNDLSRRLSSAGHMEPARAKFLDELVRVTKEVKVFQTAKGGTAYGWISEVEEKDSEEEKE